MIEIRNIHKSFNGKVILDDVSGVMESGKINLIIGSSGSGKTVLIKCIIGLIQVDSGQILYDGRNFTELDDKDKKELRTQIGMLFQGSALFDSLNVEQNVMFPLDMFTKMTLNEKKGTCCHKCGHTHVKGTAHPTPYNTGKSNCKYRD